MRCAKRAAAWGFTLVELLVVIAIIGVLVAMLLPGIQLARESARRTSCVNNLRQIGAAVHMYHDANGAFPPGGVSPGPCCSVQSYTCWTIQILPFLEQQQYYDRYDQNETNEWNAKAGNLGLAGQQRTEGGKKAKSQPYFMPVYSCPSDIYRDVPTIPDSGPARDMRIEYMPGSYRGVGGKSDGTSGWWDNNPRHRKLPRRWRGVFHVVDAHMRPETFGAVFDGLSNTFMVGEYSTMPSKSVPGPKGDGLSRRTFWAYTYGAYNRSDAMPEGRTLLSDVDLCTSAGGQGDFEPCYRAWGSFHSNVLNFVLCDASVRTLPITIDTRVFTESATIAGREVVQLP
jgi:prepilin-type N-terminal cleavage/methylation domain-containing protein